MRQEFLKNTGPMSSDIETFGNVVPTTSNQSTLFAEAFRVSPTALPENVKAQVTTVTSGENLPELFACLSRHGCWLKTSQAFFQPNLDGTLDPFCETWPRSGMLCNGNVYRLQPLALPTAGKESGSSPKEWYPTPIVSDSKGASTERFKGSPKCRGNLREVLRTGPTDGLYPHPKFVEWLMGFPTGFTDSPVLATPSSRKSSKSSAKPS